MNVIKRQIIILGMYFGYWKVIKQSDYSKSYYDCLCTGCNLVTKSIRKWNLINKQSTSCGCKKTSTMEQTNLKKHKCKFVQQNQQIKLKSQQRLLERYGVDNYSKTKQFIEKCRQTSQQNWGEDHHTKSQKWKLLQQPKFGMIVLGVPFKKNNKPKE